MPDDPCSQRSLELETALALVEQPKAGLLALGAEPLWSRLYCRQGPHRALPAPLGLALASLAGRVAWRRLGPRTQALQRAWTFTRSPDERVLARFARRHLREYRRQDELFWRPWLVRRMRVEGGEHLAAARAGGGVIVAGLHVGPMAHLQLALARRLQATGRRLYISRWARLEDEGPQEGPRARYLPAKVARLEAAGARYVGRGGSYAIFRELLARGETCWMAIDTAAIKRGRVVPLAGHPTRLATGIAALARETGATIVPGCAHRDRWRPAATLQAPIDPAGYAGDDELHDRLAAAANEMIAAHRGEIMPDLALTIDWGGRTAAAE
jgi:lauroyl/myristoyl acyltransferase